MYEHKSKHETTRFSIEISSIPLADWNQTESKSEETFRKKKQKEEDDEIPREWEREWTYGIKSSNDDFIDFVLLLIQVRLGATCFGYIKTRGGC